MEKMFPPEARLWTKLNVPRSRLVVWLGAIAAGLILLRNPPPFGVAEFLGVFARYNAAVWPAQIVLTGLAVGCVFLARRSRPWSDRTVSGILAALWIWMGIVYHFGFFRAINPAAAVFGTLFLIEGAAFGVGAWRRTFRFRIQPTVRGAAGALLIGFALGGYPLLAHGFGHRYPASPTFGLPCPTTILTLGLLLWAEIPPHRAVLAIPLAWSAVGGSAAMHLGMGEDLGLAIAGVVVALLTILPRVARASLPVVLREKRVLIDPSR